MILVFCRYGSRLVFLVLILECFLLFMKALLWIEMDVLVIHARVCGYSVFVTFPCKVHWFYGLSLCMLTLPHVLYHSFLMLTRPHVS
jgi:hypothetical protein